MGQGMTVSSKRFAALATAATMALVGAPSCRGVATARQAYHLPAQPLGDALRAIALASGTPVVVASDLVAGKTAPSLDGDYTPTEAVVTVLAGSGLAVHPIGQGLVVTRSAASASASAASHAASGDSAASEIVVTGTNIRGANPVGSPLIRLDRKDIDRSGYATTQQILQSIPQNYGGGQNEGSYGLGSLNGEDTNQAAGSNINLRGLGSSSTLVLFDGSRVASGGIYGTFADISLIPSTAIERVEVLTDGSSALYGSDAVAGVVNVIFRDSYEGAETRARFGAASGFHEAQISQIVGHGWTGGHLTLAYEYYHHGNLAAADRAYATENLTAFGGPDYRSDFSNPGTIHVGGTSYAIPAGQDGTALRQADFVAGTANLGDGRAATDLLPSQRRHSGYLALRQDLSDRLTFSLHGLVSDRTSSLRIAPIDSPWVVPSTNPFYVDPSGTGQPVVVDYDFTRDYGALTGLAHVRDYNAVAGLDWHVGRWSVAARGTFGQETEAIREVNIVNYIRLAAALADPDPATAFNLFGDGSHTNPATLASVRGSLDETGRYRLWSGDIKADGPLFRLPGGSAKLAVGGEYRIEQYALDEINDITDPTPTLDPIPGLPIRRTILAGFAELLLPVIGNDATLPGIRSLTLSAAGRIEHYNDFGTTTNPKLGLDWTPVDGLVVRSSFGTSFRAPGFLEVRQGFGTSQYEVLPLADPRAPGGMTNALVLFGNAPGLRPEKATTWTVGAEAHPSFLPGVHLQLDYFNVNYRDRIQNLASNYPILLQNRSIYGSLIYDHPSAAAIAAYYADPSFSNPLGVAPGDVGAIVDVRTKNLSRVKQDGIDFDLGYQRKLGEGDLDIGVAGAYTFHANRQLLPGAPFADTVNTLGYPVAVRIRAHAAATLGRVDVSGFLNFIGGYRNENVTPVQHVSSWTTVDLTLGYRLPADHGPLAGTRLVLTASNLFDRDPPYVQNRSDTSAIGYDPANASPVGRMVSFEVIKSW